MILIMVSAVLTIFHICQFLSNLYSITSLILFFLKFLYFITSLSLILFFFKFLSEIFTLYRGLSFSVSLLIAYFSVVTDNIKYELLCFHVVNYPDFHHRACRTFIIRVELFELLSQGMSKRPIIRFSR
uniref:Uncharacterized protein n=1 Tax=Cacopsylla melanoneura TaxID=428564 RepID=A0A8D8T8C1_9HEMI